MLKNHPYFSIHGSGNDHGGGVAGLMEQFLSVIEQIVAHGPVVFFQNLLPGVAAMPNIHPLIVHFPIAFLFAFFFVDLCGTLFKSVRLRTSASTLLYLGIISVIGAVAAGLHAATTVPHDEVTHAIMEEHEHFGLTVAFLSIALGIWRIISAENLKGLVNFLHLSIALVILIIMTIGVDLGGLMVYKHGVGVKKINRTQEQAVITDHHHDHNHQH